MRKALELSIITAPAETTAGRNAREMSPPALKQRDVDAAERGFGHLFDRNILALELQRLAGRAGRSEKFQIFDGEVGVFPVS